MFSTASPEDPKQFYRMMRRYQGQHKHCNERYDHMVASELIKVYPEYIVSRVLGRRAPRSTRRYAWVNEDQVRAVLAGRRQR